MEMEKTKAELIRDGFLMSITDFELNKINGMLQYVKGNFKYNVVCNSDNDYILSQIKRTV